MAGKLQVASKSSNLVQENTSTAVVTELEYIILSVAYGIFCKQVSSRSFGILQEVRKIRTKKIQARSIPWPSRRTNCRERSI